MLCKKHIRFAALLLLAASLHAGVLIFGFGSISIKLEAPETPPHSSVTVLTKPMNISTNHPKPAASLQQITSLKQVVKSPSISHLISESYFSDFPVPAEFSRELPIALPLIEAREILPDQIYTDESPVSSHANTDLIVSSDYLDASFVDKRVTAQQDLLPTYPPEAYAARQSGRVVAEVLVGESGLVDSIHILVSTDGFKTSAIDALKMITFNPAEQSGKAVPSRLIVEIEYKLVDPISGILVPREKEPLPDQSSN